MGKTPPDANTEEPACVCARVCAHARADESEGTMPLGHCSSLVLAVSASETFQPNVKLTTTTTAITSTRLYLCFYSFMHVHIHVWLCAR